MDRPGMAARSTHEPFAEHALLDAPIATAPDLRPEPRPEHDTRASREQWTVVLAGGEGRRIRPFTTSDDGVAVPKQYCRFRDERTLLTATLERALRFTSPEHVLVVVREAHREWWSRELTRLPAANVIAQLEDRGTAVAILQSLVEIHTRDRDPRVIVMPSDCEVDDEAVLLRSIAVAQWTAHAFPDDLVLLGIEPSYLDPDYGLIVPEHGRAAIGRRIRSFVERPPLGLAHRLMHEGAMWNSFIFACNGWTLYDLFHETLPRVTDGYLRRLERTDGGPAARARVAAELPSEDFAHDVLEVVSSGRLRLVPVPRCGWTGLGTPARLASWLDRHRDARFWREHRLRRLGFGGMGGLDDAAPAG